MMSIGSCVKRKSVNAKSRRLDLNPGRLIRSCAMLLKGESRGSALIETALALPLLLMILTGVCVFAVAFNNELALTGGVGAGGQYLQLIRTSSTDPCKDTLTAIENAAPNLTPANITLSFSFNGTAVSGNSCPGDETDLVQGQPATVTATYPCSLAMYGKTFSGCQLSAKVTEYEY
jgi:Flp pilus assembly protein TadG